jgi:hypothetical protein
MTATEQRPQHKDHSLANLQLPDAVGGDWPSHKRPIADAILSYRSLRWLSILVICILLWLLGASWRTLVMVAAAASMFAIGIDQLENTPKH